MKDVKYELDIFEALKIILDGGAVKGEHFTKGVFIRLNSYGQLVIVDVNRYYEEDERVFFKGLSKQKFRELTVLTLKELSK